MIILNYGDHLLQDISRKLQKKPIQLNPIILKANKLIIQIYSIFNLQLCIRQANFIQ